MRKGDQGVSPVIGFVLILAVSLAGIVVISLWAIPLIESSSSAQAHGAVTSSFQDLAAQFRQVITAGAPDSTAQVSLPNAGGSIADESAIWAISASLSSTVNLTYGGLHDGTATTFTVKDARSAGSTQALTLYGRQFTETTRTTVAPCNSGATTMSLDPGDEVSLDLEVGSCGGGAVDLDDGPVLVNMTDGSGTDLALIVLGDVGRLRHELPGVGAAWDTVFEAGGSGYRRGTNWVMDEHPTASYTAGSTTRTALMTLPDLTNVDGLGGGGGNTVLALRLNRTWNAYSATSADHVRLIPPSDTYPMWEQGLKYPNGAWTPITDTVGSESVGNLYRQTGDARVVINVALIQAFGRGIR